jgi:hypothetical protein
MMQAFDVLRPELARILVVRDLAAAARHALDIQTDADAVSFTVKFDKNGIAVDVEYSKGRIPIAGWGQ